LRAEREASGQEPDNNSNLIEQPVSTTGNRSHSNSRR
jgi:hypothetical protein